MYTIIIIQVGWRKQNISLGRYDVNSADVCWHFCQHSICLSSFYFAAFAFSAQISFHLLHEKGDIYEIVPISPKRFLRKKTIHESMKGWYISFIASIYWSSKNVIGELKSKSDTLDLQVTPKTCILRSDQARWLFKWSAWNIWFCRCRQYFVI